MTRMTRRFASVLVLAAAVTSAACGGDDNGGSGPSQSSTLRMQNTTESTILYVNFTPCSEPTWGPDRLGDTEVINPGAQRNWTVTPGCYDVRARTGSASQEFFDVTLADDDVTTVTVDDLELDVVVAGGAEAAVKTR